MRNRHSRAAAVAAALFLCAASGGFPRQALAAAQFAIEPLLLNLPAEKLATSLKLGNAGAAPVTVQAELVSWNQDKGEDSYAATSDFVVSPPVFSLAPGATQVVRIGRLKRATAPQSERAYRIKLTEVPSADSGSGGKLATVMQLSLPIFVPPAERKGRPATEITSVVEGMDLRASVTNPGLVHDKLTRMTLLQDGKVIAERTLNYYVLAGAKRELVWPGALKSARPGALELKIQLEGKDRFKSQALGPPPPATPTPAPGAGGKN